MARKKSIVDIQVNDKKFKEFQGQYNKFLANLETMPRGWDKLDKGVGKTSETLRSTTAALLAQQAAFRSQDKDETKKRNTALNKAREARSEEARAKREERALTQKTEKEAKERQKQVLVAEKERQKQTKSVLNDVKSIGKTVANTTVDLFKWVGIGEALGGLAGFGSLWGVADLAGRATDMRRAALSLGTTAPGQEAANIFLSPFMDVNGALSGIAGAKADIGSYWAQRATGVNFSQMDPVQSLLALLQKGQAYVQRPGYAIREQDPIIKAFEAAGISIDTLRALQGISKTELAQAIQGTATGMKSLNESLGPGNLIAWTKLQVALHNAGVQIEATLIEGLLPLAKSLPQLSVSVTEAIKTFFATADTKELIDKLGKGIKGLADDIASGRFQNAIEHAAFLMEKLADGIEDFLKFVGVIKQSEAQKDMMRQQNLLRWLNVIDPLHLDTKDRTAAQQAILADQAIIGMGDVGDGGGGGSVRPSKNLLKSIPGMAKFFEGKGWSAAATSGILANLWSESGFNPFNVGDFDRQSGTYSAYGIGQWHKTRQQEYLRLFGHTMQSVKDPVQALAEQMAFENMELQGKTSDSLSGIAGRKLHTSGINAAQAGAYVSVFGERPADKIGEANKRGLLAHQIFVTVNAPPGSQSAVQGAALTGAQ